jgi:hypothetical protein
MTADSRASVSPGYRLRRKTFSEQTLLLARLKEVARQIGIRVREEDLEGDGEFPIAGGLCRFRGREVLLLDRRAGVGQQTELLLKCLARADLSNVFLVPAVRERIELFRSPDDDGDRVRNRSPHPG